MFVNGLVGTTSLQNAHRDNATSFEHQSLCPDTLANFGWPQWPPELVGLAAPRESCWIEGCGCDCGRTPLRLEIPGTALPDRLIVELRQLRFTKF